MADLVGPGPGTCPVRGFQGLCRGSCHFQPKSGHWSSLDVARSPAVRSTWRRPRAPRTCRPSYAQAQVRVEIAMRTAQARMKQAERPPISPRRDAPRRPKVVGLAHPFWSVPGDRPPQKRWAFLERDPRLAGQIERWQPDFSGRVRNVCAPEGRLLAGKSTIRRPRPGRNPVFRSKSACFLGGISHPASTIR